MVHARLPERPKGADCKSAGIAFRSSNLLPGTDKPRAFHQEGAGFLRVRSRRDDDENKYERRWGKQRGEQPPSFLLGKIE